MIVLTPLVFSLSYVRVDFPKIFLIQVLGTLSAAVWLWGAGRTGINREPSAADAPAAVFPALAGLSAIWAVNGHLALERLVFLVSLVAVYFVVSRTSLSSKSIAGAVSVSASIAAVYGIFQAAGMDFLSSPAPRPFSSLGNTNCAGEFMAPSLIITIALSFSLGGKKSRILAGAAAALQAVYLFITTAKGAWAGLAAGGLVMFLLLPGRKMKAVKAAACLSAGALAAFFIVSEISGGGLFDRAVFNVYSLATLQHDSVQARMHIWGVVFSMLRDRPLLGAGAGNFWVAYPLYRVPEEIRFLGAYRIVNYAHNDFLEIASELGAAGLGVFLWLIASAARIISREKKRLGVFKASSAGAAACILASAMFGFPLHMPSTALLFWVFIGMIARKNDSDSGQMPSERTWPLRAALAALFVLTAVYSSATLLSDRSLHSANRRAAAEDWEGAKRELEKSIGYYYPKIRAQASLAYTYLKLDDAGRAYARLYSVLELHPNDLWSNFTLGRLYAHSGEYGRAAEYLEKAARLNPAYYSRLAEVFIMLGDTEKAAHYIRRQAELGFADEYSCLFRGVLHEEKGAPERALRAYRRALEMNPGLQLGEKIKRLERELYENP